MKYIIPYRRDTYIILKKKRKNRQLRREIFLFTIKMKLLIEMNHIFFIYKILYMLKNNDIFTLNIENYKKKKRKNWYKISIFTYLLIFIISISFINLMVSK